jgi:hypothetical protein
MDSPVEKRRSALPSPEGVSTASRPLPSLIDRPPLGPGSIFTGVIPAYASAPSRTMTCNPFTNASTAPDCAGRPASGSISQTSPAFGGTCPPDPAHPVMPAVIIASRINSLPAPDAGRPVMERLTMLESSLDRKRTMCSTPVKCGFRLPRSQTECCSPRKRNFPKKELTDFFGGHNGTNVCDNQRRLTGKLPGLESCLNRRFDIRESASCL